MLARYPLGLSTALAETPAARLLAWFPAISIAKPPCHARPAGCWLCIGGIPWPRPAFCAGQLFQSSQQRLGIFPHVCSTPWLHAACSVLLWQQAASCHDGAPLLSSWSCDCLAHAPCVPAALDLLHSACCTGLAAFNLLGWAWVLLQETASNHAVAMWGRSDEGFASDPMLSDEGLIFVMTRLQIQMDAYPKWCAKEIDLFCTCRSKALWIPFCKGVL